MLFKQFFGRRRRRRACVLFRLARVGLLWAGSAVRFLLLSIAFVSGVARLAFPFLDALLASLCRMRKPFGQKSRDCRLRFS